MVKTLTPIGTGLGLVLDAVLLDSLGIRANTPLEITSDGTTLHIRPLPTPERDLRDSATRAMDAHAQAFEDLAK